MALVEVVFDPFKHSNAWKGSLVGDKKGVLGYLVYEMPSVGAMDGDKDALKDAENCLKTKPGVCDGSTNTGKDRVKNLRRATHVHYGV